MGQFNGLLRAEFRPPKNWHLTKELTYITDDITNNVDLWRMAVDLFKYNTKLNHLPSDSVLINIKVNQLVINVPPTFSTDLASVPRPLWWLIAPTDMARAAVIHDFLYSLLECYISYTPNLPKRSKNRLRKLCDQVFYFAMVDSEPKIPMWKINAADRAVRLFGWTAIKGY
jgi:hypothetical protein